MLTHEREEEGETCSSPPLKLKEHREDKKKVKSLHLEKVFNELAEEVKVCARITLLHHK